MRLQNVNLEELISWAEATAWDGEEEITQLIGFVVERLERICREARLELYPAIEEKLMELFFELGRLQGMREAWQMIVNQE